MGVVRIKKTFIGNGNTYAKGSLAILPDQALDIVGDRVEVLTLQTYLGEHLAETDRMGRPWPSRFLLDMPAADRQRLRDLEQAIDAAVIGNEAEALDSHLKQWRSLLLSKLN